MSHPRRSGDAGVSLIEVLVSLAIFAIIGVAGLAVLNTVARTGERTEGRLERLADIDRAFLILRRDLLQMRGAAVTLDAGILRFVREAEEGPVALAYLQEDETLQRRIERTTSDDIDQPLLPDVTMTDWQLMDRAGRWHRLWPPGATAEPSRPTAAELTLDIRTSPDARPRTITRLFVLAAGQGR